VYIVETVESVFSDLSIFAIINYVKKYLFRLLFLSRINFRSDVFKQLSVEASLLNVFGEILNYFLPGIIIPQFS
jgi:hypothetical protein